MRARTRWKLGGTIAATGLLAGGLAQSAFAADSEADRTDQETTRSMTGEGAVAANGVPLGFVPEQSSWTSNDTGTVLGTAPCDGNAFCATLVTTTDGGTTWAEETLPESIGAPGDVFTVEADSITTRLVSAYDSDDNTVIYASYDGSAWQPENFGETRELDITDLATIGGKAHVGVTTYGDTDADYTGTYYRAPIGSAEWQRVSDVTDTKIADIAFAASGSKAVAVHQYYSDSQPETKLGTTGDGSTWRVRSDPCRGGMTRSTWPAAASEQSLLLLCEDYNLDELKLLGSADGGATFERSGTFGLPRGEIYDLAAYDDTVGIAYREGRHGCDVAISHDDGQSWTRSLTVSGGYGDDLQFTDADNGTIVCEGQSGADVFRTTDGGGTWKSLGLRTSGAVPDWLDPVSSSWISPDAGYVLGWTPCAERQYCAAMLRTEDGGQTWTELPAPDLEWVKAEQKQAHLTVAERDGETVALVRYAPGNSTTKEAFASYDGGQTWQAEDFGVADGSTLLLDMAAAGSYLYALVEHDDGSGGPSAYSTMAHRTPIGSDSWEPFDALSDPGSAALDEINVRGDIGAAFIGGDYFDGPGPRLLSTNDGTAWTEQQTPCDPNQRQTYMPAGENRIYAFCPKQSGYVFPQVVAVSEDGGSSFSTVSAGPAKAVNLGGSDAVGDTIVLGDFVENIDSPGCTIRVSTDGGASFTKQNLEGPGYDGKVTEVRLDPDGTGTALCVTSKEAGGGVLSRTTDGGQTWQPVDLTG